MEKACLSLISNLKTVFSTVTEDDRYIRCNMQNFLQQLQTSISQKQKIFSGFFIAYLECASNLEHIEKKDEHSSLVISEIIDSERVGSLNV